MSLPGLIAQPILTGIVTNPLDVFFNIFNTNPYFIGLMMVVLNLGGKFLSLEITKGQEYIFQLPLFRKFIIFVVLFISTRNLWVALTLSLIIVFLMNHLLNECSPLYLFKTEETLKQCKERETQNKGSPVNGMTSEESDILQRLSDKQRKISMVAAPPAQSTITTSPTTSFPSVITTKDIQHVYGTNINLFKNSLY